MLSTGKLWIVKYLKFTCCLITNIISIANGNDLYEYWIIRLQMKTATKLNKLLSYSVHLQDSILPLASFTN